jgi:hypothetical protein
MIASRDEIWGVKFPPAPKAHAPPLLNGSECFYPQSLVSDHMSE